MPDIKAAVVAADEETSPATSTDLLMLINAVGTTFKKIKLVTLFEAIDALQYKGVIDCSANPNYPAANAGHVYKVSVAGKIGGGSGPSVSAGDTIICNVDSSAAGNHATVGANWGVIPGPSTAGTGTITTASLADEAEGTGTVAIARSFMLSKVEASVDCRIRFYSSAAARTADSAREFGDTSFLGTEHGIICDLLLNSGTGLIWNMAPPAIGSSGDSPRVSTVYYAIQNLSGGTTVIDVDIGFLVLES